MRANTSLGREVESAILRLLPGDRFPRPSPLVAKLIEKVSADYGIETSQD